MPNNILAIDQGTTNTKALLIDPSGAIVARGACPTAIHYPQPAWVEQDPLDIWRSTREAIDACLNAVANPDLAAVAVTNQRETALVWERATGQPVGPAVVWQCRRSAPFCDELKARGLTTFIHERTGLQIDPMFSAGKIRWILDHTENGHARAGRGELCAGTVDSWMLWNLSGGVIHACDLTNASRTQLLNLHTLEWDADLLEIFGIPAAMLPQVNPSAHVYGETVAVGTLPAGIPIASMIGDSHGALYGHAGFRPGTIKATYGTGSSLMTPTPTPILSQQGLSTTIAWVKERPTYALEGNIYVTGAAAQWLAQLLSLEHASETEALAGSVDDAGGVYFVPAFVGLGAPHWDDGARGLLTGLTRGTTSAHLARATLEAIAYQVRDVFDVMQAEAGLPLAVLMADGGASANDLLMQFQADILDCPMLRSTSGDVSALGATYLAGLTVGLWRSEDDIAALPRLHDRFEPQMPASQREALYTGWQEAVARTMFRPG